MKCDKQHGHKPLQQCIDASKAQCANSMGSRTASCGKHGSFNIQLKMHKAMRNQSRWNWKTLNCALQLQNNDNNTQWRAFVGMHTRVFEVVKDKKQTEWICEWWVKSCSGRGGIFKLTYQAGGALGILFRTEFSHSNTFTPIHCIHKDAVYEQRTKTATLWKSNKLK